MTVKPEEKLNQKPLSESILNPAAVEVPTRRFKWILFSTKLIVSTALLAWIVSRANVSDIFRSLSDARPRWFLLALISPAIGIYIIAIRWGGLLRAQSVQISTPTLARSCLVASFVQQFLPSTIGGDAVRAHDSWKEGASISGAVAALLVDRMVGFLVLVLFAALAVSFPQQLTREYPAIYAIVAIGAASLILATWITFVPPGILLRLGPWSIEKIPSRVRHPLERLLKALRAYSGKHRQLTRALTLSILLQINVVTFYWFVGQSMGFDIPYYMYYLIVPVAILVMLVPISLNGVGVREGIFVFLFSIHGIQPAHAIAFAWLEYGIFLLYGLIGGVVYLMSNRPKAGFAGHKHLSVLRDDTNRAPVVHSSES